MTAPLTVEAMDDTALIVHYRALGFHPDAFAFVNEKEAAESLNCSQKKLYRLRTNSEWFEPGECRLVAGEWRYLIRALLRYHAEQFAPETW